MLGDSYIMMARVDIRAGLEVGAAARTFNVGALDLNVGAATPTFSVGARAETRAGLEC